MEKYGAIQGVNHAGDCGTIEQKFSWEICPSDKQ